MVAEANRDSDTDLAATWAAPESEGGAWLFDPMHFPRPLSPLFGDLFCRAWGHGFTIGAQENHLPVKRASAAVVNNYYYHRIQFINPADEREAQALEDRGAAAVRRESARMMERWETEHLPNIHVSLSRLRALAPGNTSGPRARGLVAEIQDILDDLWKVHFRITIPMLVAILDFTDLYQDLFGGSDADAYALLLGRSSKSVEAGIALSNLAGTARDTNLTDVILSTPVDTLVETLSASPHGRTFLDALRSYLDVYGLRQDLFDFSQVTWQEDPRVALANVQSYLRTGHDMATAHKQTALAADAALAAAQARLSHYPRPVNDEFTRMAKAARNAAFIQEEYNFYLDQQGIALVRLAFLRFGRRFVAQGLIDCPDDIFLLMSEEVAALAADPDGANSTTDARAIVERRRTEMRRAARLVPPPFIGQPPAPVSAEPGLVGRALAKFFGGVPQEADSPNHLNGNAGSRGTVRGVARVALTLDEAKSLQPGEILVTTTTMPAWTPLFGTAAAIVTDTGGALSHCAIVAREYGIPAVVGASGATRTIKSGDLITVDGDRGIVILGTDGRDA